MSRIVQEKFEVRAPKKPEGVEGTGWASDSSARTRRGLQTRGRSDGRYESFQGDDLNQLPPGMNISDQEHADLPTPAMAENFGTGSQATSDVTRTSMRTGFDRKDLSPTDDMYTREHNDAFYDTVEVDGVEGYVERNNYMDRM